MKTVRSSEENHHTGYLGLLLNLQIIGPALLLATLVFVAPPARAAVTEAWMQRFSTMRIDDTTPATGHGVAVAIEGTSNVIAAGNSYVGDLGHSTGYSYTAKYAAANGALLWEKYWSFVHAMALDASGNVVVTGISSNPPPHGPEYTAKFAGADGALLWEKGGGGTAVAIDRTGNVVVTGFSSNATNSGPYTTKYAAANGAVIWETRYADGPTNGYSQANALVVDANSNVVVTGYSGSNPDYYTAKYAAADGALLWEQRYTGPANSSDEALAVAVDESGNVVVTGFSWKPFGDADYYTAKYAAADGALLWERLYDSHGYDFPAAVAVDGDANVVVTGSAFGTNGFYDYYTAKYAAATGALLWEQRYNGPANNSDEAHAMSVDSSGNVIVTGDSYNNNINSDYYTAKYAAADGALLWEQRYNGPANGPDRPVSLALGPNGMVAVTGASDGNFSPDGGFDSGVTYDYVTIVYRENLPAVAIERVPTGVRIRFTGVPGHTYNIERAPAVTGPWTTLATPTTPITGLLEYTDTNPDAANSPQRFYRMRWE